LAVKLRGPVSKESGSWGFPGPIPGMQSPQGRFWDEEKGAGGTGSPRALFIAHILSRAGAAAARLHREISNDERPLVRGERRRIPYNRRAAVELKSALSAQRTPKGKVIVKCTGIFRRRDESVINLPELRRRSPFRPGLGLNIIGAQFGDLDNIISVRGDELIVSGIEKIFHHAHITLTASGPRSRGSSMSRTPRPFPLASARSASSRGRYGTGKVGSSFSRRSPSTS